uniref:Uncharacterized protein n=1 Tax=Colobus angolensis palliatus TaxID=336983 RepID=A0A2K5K7V6_COLAP
MAAEGTGSGCGLGCPVGISSADTLQAVYAGASVSPSAQWGAWRDGFGLCFCLFSPSAHSRMLIHEGDLAVLVN